MSKEIIEGYRLLMEVEKDSKKRKLYQDVIDGYEIISELKDSSKNEDVLLAPNGKPSNLNPQQYKLVRTSEFKDWFGDWENSPETSSKVVDENGEPLVVYHGTGASFYTFEKTNFGKLGKGMYFTSFFNDAKKYANRYDGGIVLGVFLNSKQLAIISNPFAKDELPDKYDGVWAFKGGEGGEEIVVFEPNQIKLADGTNTTFDGSNPDIRFDGGGEINNYKEFYEKLKIVDGSIFIGQKFTDVFPFLGRKKIPNDFRATMKQYHGILKRIEENNYATKSMKQRDLNKLERIKPNINNTEYLSKFYLDSQGTIISFE